MHITADRERCVGAGQCVLAAPAVFDQDDDGLVAPLTLDPGSGEQEAVGRRSTCAHLRPSGSTRSDRCHRPAGLNHQDVS